MNFLYFILIGALAGWAAGKLTKGESFGLLGNIIVGQYTMLSMAAHSTGVELEVGHDGVPMARDGEMTR